MARLRCTFALASTLALLAVNTAAAAYEAPDPGGDEGAAVPVPPPTKLFGFNDSSYMVPERQVSAGELADLFVGAGANAGRINLDWRYLERDRDVWDEAGWAMYEAMYDQLVIRGLTPLMVIGAAPPWARDPGAAQTCSSHQDCEYPPARAMVGEWAEFAAEVTRRFPQAAIAVAEVGGGRDILVTVVIVVVVLAASAARALAASRGVRVLIADPLGAGGRGCEREHERDEHAKAEEAKYWTRVARNHH
jgi:hypothetical protein